MSCAEAQARLLRPVGVLVQQETKLGRRLMTGAQSQQHALTPRGRLPAAFRSGTWSRPEMLRAGRSGRAGERVRLLSIVLGAHGVTCVRMCSGAAMIDAPADLLPAVNPMLSHSLQPSSGWASGSDAGADRSRRSVGQPLGCCGRNRDHPLPAGIGRPRVNFRDLP